MCEQEAHKKAVGIMVIKEPQVEIIDNHTSHPLKRLKSGNYSGQEDEMALASCSPGVKTQSGALETGWNFFQKLNLWHRNPIPRYMTKRNENVCLHKNVFMDLYPKMVCS